ncbi:MAG: alpha-glucan family phosphorylase [Dehalococcoidia bacterium]|nr:alpha-glucan family phosphorylase [Dehalococcoidia bacterium]MDW8119784.1 alpha-glucan family phosphorylase [Chloroflexota bacterium]
MSTPSPQPVIAYFCMEIALTADMPTYSGGLGVLAGDTLRAAADMGLPLLGVTLVHRQGYFRQHLGRYGSQLEEPAPWSPEALLEPLSLRVTLPLAERLVHIRAWRYRVQGLSGHTVPVYFLDTDLPENDPLDRSITDWLYGGESRYRLRQEAVLGLGGVALLRALGVPVGIYHLNEGHTALVPLALLDAHLSQQGKTLPEPADLEAVRRKCVFTTHTPVPAGHDQFPLSMVRAVLGERVVALLHAIGCSHDNTLHMTRLALTLSGWTNAVSARHREVAQGMFPQATLHAITNGIHHPTWVSPPFRALYNRYLPGWEKDAFLLRYASTIPLDALTEAHREAKHLLLQEVARRTQRRLDPQVFTIGFGRRATGYKRMDFVFTDMGRLRQIAERVGKIQILMAGKAHPRDTEGKELIRKVFAASAALGEVLPVVYLEDYDLTLAQLLCAGVDLWLNTPRKPLEACGTSGMKAALNGVPSFSVLDGWWLEGHIEGVTGWAIGGPEPVSNMAYEAHDLYDKLERIILPMFYRQPRAYQKVMQSAIALNGPLFSAQRMLHQYLVHAYTRHNLP